MMSGRFRAVVFDLWGTLVDELSYPEANRCLYRQKCNETADVIGVDPEEFTAAWAAGAEKRMAGEPPSLEAAIADICAKLGVPPHIDRVKAGADVRLQYVREALSPRSGVIETISTLREQGFRVGLISNCGEEVTQLWDGTPFAPLFDAAVFSFSARLVKPDPRIYRLAIDQLGFSPEQCLFVGDGSGNELTGASNAGMTPVLIRAPYDQDDGARQSWDGLRISSIPEVLDLLR